MTRTPFQDWSIKTKLSLIALLTCVTALVLAGGALFTYEVQLFKRTLVHDLQAQAKILAGLSAPALTFNDKLAATDLLNELRNQPQIKWAVMFQEGNVFAEYQRTAAERAPQDLAPRGEGHVFGPDGLRLHRDILLKGEQVGTIYLCADTSELRARLWEYAAILLAVFFVSSLIALLLAAQLQRTIIGPVQRLSDTAQTIAANQNYSVRVEERGRDELGRLTRAFNQMLSRIQAQDSELREERERFEIAVAGARDGLWDWNLVTNDIYLSPQWKAMLGHAETELARPPDIWAGLLHDADRDTTLRTLEEYLKGQRPAYEAEFRLRHRDGSFRWILARGAALRDAYGQPYRMAGSNTDITERKQAAEELQNLGQRLVEASRQAGMAEVATGVLHNVGNVLNSVNVSSDLVLQQLRKSKTASLAKAARLLHDHQAEAGAFLTQDAQGKQLPAFFTALSTQLMEEQAGITREMEDLHQNIDHIKQIVAMQQSYAKVSGALENLALSELVEDALRMAATALARHKISVVREYETVPLVLVDRHKVLQILVNLVSNAKQALDVRPTGRQLTLRIRPGEGGRVRLEVADNGAGIPPENLTRIFNHGFTTKRTGHGFGLHSGANAAKEMGGRLNVHSEGAGSGATFILELPGVAVVTVPCIQAA